MKVVVIGGNGQLGHDVTRAFAEEGHAVTSLTHQDVEVSSLESVRESLNELKPEMVVNTSAFHHVEKCEAEPALAFAINAIGARNLAQVTKDAGATLLHISTDYVFDGAAHAPYPEDARTGPLNVYGKSKLKGERHVQALCRRHVIVRSSGLYGVAGSAGKGGNFVRTMLRIGADKGEVSVVTDQTLAPTSTNDLAKVIWRLIDRDAQGLFHVTNSGACSWFEFAQAIFELRDMSVEVHPIDSITLGYRARRPAYSVLDNARLDHDGYGVMRPWREALARHLEALGPLT